MEVVIEFLILIGQQTWPSCVGPFPIVSGAPMILIKSWHAAIIQLWPLLSEF